MSDNFRVTVAAVIGTGSPATSLFFQNSEPVLSFLLALGQLGVAIITILYIYRKWKNARDEK